MVKFEHDLNEYDAIVGVDLASRKTGVCVYSIQGNSFIDFLPITVKETTDKRFLNLFVQLKDLFEKIQRKYGKIFVIEERLPNQAGLHSTIATLQSLAQSHALMRLAVDMIDGVEMYDEHGIHTTSVKALFKKESCPKPQKSDIRQSLVEIYHLDDTKLTDDISDAIAVVHTLLNKKWNQDIDDHIKEIKKEIKKLKLPHTIRERQLEVERLNQLKI